jgi:hypothetical protein
VGWMIPARRLSFEASGDSPGGDGRQLGIASR